jgi:hypothetical protein
VDVVKDLGFLVIPFDWGWRKRRSWSWGFESYRMAGRLKEGICC